MNFDPGGIPPVLSHEIDMVPIERLKHHPKNPRRGDVAAIVDLMKRHGFWGAVVVQRSTDHIIVGNHRVMAARELQIPAVPVAYIDVDDEWAERILVADNRSSDLATNDNEALAELLAQFAASPSGLDGTGYTEGDLDNIIDEIAEAASGKRKLKADPDEIPDDVECRVKPGDIWRLGEHRLLCGDSTKPEDAARLLPEKSAHCMWTDPPYGVSYVGKTAKALTIDNDGAAGLPALLNAAFSVANTVLKEGAAIYVAHPAGALSIEFLNAFVATGWRYHEGLVWVKDAMVLGHSDYHYQHEPVIFGSTPGDSPDDDLEPEMEPEEESGYTLQHQPVALGYTPGAGRHGRGGKGWYGDNCQVSIFEIPRPKRSEEHPTMKPVALMTAMLVNSAKPGHTVYEPFGGSGSTLIACEELGIRCRAIEISPQFCDVILARWEAVTEEKAELEA